MFDTLLYVDHAMQMFHDLLDAGNLRPKVRSMVSVLVSMAEMKPNTALLIKPKWANLILEGKKGGKYVAQVPPSERWWPWR